MATNPYYVVTGAPVTQSRGVSATIRSEYSAIHTGFDAVYVAMLLRGLKGGETWTGTHVFTGATVTFATQTALDNSTKAATTAYADSAVSTSAATLNAAIALKANIASPTLTGTPAAPTAVAGTNNTQIATTAYADGAVATLAALKADIASPTLTGVPTAPTASAGTSTTQIATTAFAMALSVAAGNVPVGGTTGQRLKKNSATNYDMDWATDAPIPAGESFFTALNFGGF